MPVLVDSNVLLRSLHPGHPHYAAAERAVATLRLRNEILCIAPQILIELWAVATRPCDDNGLGLPTDQVAAEQSVRTARRIGLYDCDPTSRIVSFHIIKGHI